MNVEEQIEWLKAAEDGCMDDERPLAAESYSQIRATMEKPLARNEKLEDAMYRFFRHIQDQMEKQAGWIQFDFYNPEIDVYEFSQFATALGDKSDAALWHDLLERYAAQTTEHGVHHVTTGDVRLDLGWTQEEVAAADQASEQTTEQNDG